MTSIVNFSFNSEPAKQILATQCPAYVSSSEQQSLRVEEGEYELVEGIVFFFFFFFSYRLI